MMSQFDLCDIFRVRHPNEKRFTWRQKNPFKQRRLDHFFISDNLQDLVEYVNIIPSVQSDHSALKLKLSLLSERERGQSHWKFNNSLTSDNTFVCMMKEEIPKIYQDSLQLKNSIVQWDFMKYRMRQLAMKYSKEKAHERKSRRSFLEKKVKTLELEITADSSEELLEEYHTYKDELESIYNYITEGIILRSKVDWYEHGEKSSKYFLNLEKRNKAKSHLRKIVIDDSFNETTDPGEILSNLRNFYSSLYKRQSNKTEKECLEYLENLNLPRLSDAEKAVCEGLLTKQECWEALISMGNNNSPGNDGLTKEFYICFFNEIVSYLIDALNLSFAYSHLSNSQQQAVITLIEKKGKDKRYLKNWRPISLINDDTKIASKCLASQVKKVLSNLIHSDQTAYVKDRYICESVRLISDILEYTDSNDIEAILFSADFEKAFDSIDHSFLFAVLESFGFGPDFIQWMRTLFYNAEICVINNGRSTGYLDLEEAQGKEILCQLTFSFWL